MSFHNDRAELAELRIKDIHTLCVVKFAFGFECTICLYMRQARKHNSNKGTYRFGNTH